MRIGIPKEIKDHEYRVGVTPAGVSALTSHGHTVLVETCAGARIGFSDAMYEAAGAMIAGQREIYGSDMIVKVKEPQPSEVALLREGQILFCYLHLAPEPELTRGLLDRKVIGIAYDRHRCPGRLRCRSLSVAGRLAVQAAQPHCRSPTAAAACCSAALGVAPGRWSSRRRSAQRREDGARPRRQSACSTSTSVRHSTTSSAA
jgi:alanine dehydrogenase